MIDHLVYLVHDLPAAAERMGRALGVDFSPGGRHLDRGTHNMLLSLGPGTYLELLAIDPANPAVVAPRWMGVDALPAAAPGRLSRWALTVNERIGPLAAQLEAALPGAGQVQAGSRALADGGELRWQLTDPGSAPAVRSLPFLLDWCGNPSPAARLPEVGCRLQMLRVVGPYRTLITTLADAQDPLEIVDGPGEELVASIVGPAGTIYLRD
ncbi:VOC family protein [Neolewinella lacunae]|uniref:VOC family protein n=1 Tax=Neolewinella lacunae TaxID=1517758 RepID=A0A923PHY9_9BACT|nr:VOC family protein [Neolewinella lacunae]MBC6994412.1 VOC family protein [Neolewinella lacunae]MDN3633343.1 VOC family protein [Neolewinella lacunae]